MALVPLDDDGIGYEDWEEWEDYYPPEEGEYNEEEDE